MKPLYFLTILFTCSTSFVWAQRTWNYEGEITDSEIIIDKNRVIELPEANRNFEKITFPVRPLTPPALRYNFQDIKLNLLDIDSRIKVLTMKQEALAKLYGTYLKAGGGNYGTSYFEGFHNSKRSEKYAYGVHVRHFNQANGPVKYSGWGENMASVNGRYYGKAVTVGGELQYTRERYNFYGYAPEVLARLGADSVKQVFNIFSARATLQNNTTEQSKNDKKGTIGSAFSYKTGISFNHFSDRFNASENEVVLDVKTRYNLADNAAIVLNGDMAIISRADSNLTGAGQNKNRNFVAIRPAYYYAKGNFEVRGGINMVYENDKDTTANAKNFHVYPAINLDYVVLPEKLTAFVGISGDMQKRTLRSFAQQNPYLMPNVTLFHTNKQLDLYGGLKGTLANGLGFMARIGYENYQNLPFFINSEQDTAKFTILYEKDKSSRINVTGELSYNKDEKFRLSWKTDYYGFSLPTIKKPWHQPTLVSSFMSTYNFRNKVYLNADFYFINSIFAKGPVGSLNQNQGHERTVELRAISNLNLKIDYRFSDRFSIFVEGDNLLAQNNPRFLYYPTRGLMVMGGLTFAF